MSGQSWPICHVASGAPAKPGGVLLLLPFLQKGPQKGGQQSEKTGPWKGGYGGGLQLVSCLHQMNGGFLGAPGWLSWLTI